jgi:hypothetical protein
MQKKTLIITLVAAALLFMPQSASAQSARDLLSPAPQAEEPAPPPEAVPPEQTPPKEYPEQYLAEKAGFADYCATDAYMSRHYDCICMSEKYIDKRMELGDTATSSIIIQSIGRECLFDKSQAPAAPSGSALDLSTLTDEQVAEMQSFYNDCAGDYHMSKGYDCECLSAKYMEERLEVGDYINRDEIMLKVQGTCLNAADAAGSTYEECMNARPVPFMKGTQEEFCTCYASNFGRMYGEAEGLNARAGTALKSRAQVMCMDLPAGVNIQGGL